MLKISFESSDQRLVSFLRSRLPAVQTALVARLDSLMIALQAHIVGDKLSGQVLHRRTGHLAGSIRPEPPHPVISGDKIEAGVQGAGPIAWYGKVHEYGGTFPVKEYVRKAISSKGNAYDRIVKAHSVTFPERSFMRSGFQDMRETIIAGLQKSIDEVLRK